MPKNTKSNPQISMKNTKQQILDAYEEIVQKLQIEDQEAADDRSTPKKADVSALINKQKPDEIVTKIGQLKIEIGEYFSKLMNKLIEETEQLEEIKKAKDAFSAEIADLHKIKAEAATLRNITQIRKEEEIKLEQDLKKLKEDINAQKEKEMSSLQDDLKNLKKEQRHEEEEYQYQLKKSRREENDEYQKQRIETEKKLMQREKAITEKEEELENLRAESKKFEATLKQEIEKIRKDTENEVRRELNNEHNLSLKEIEGEKKLADATIAHLRETVKDQKSEIAKLEKQLQLATEQIKDIAVSVINTKKPQERKVDEDKGEESRRT